MTQHPETNSFSPEVYNPASPPLVSKERLSLGEQSFDIGAFPRALPPWGIVFDIDPLLISGTDTNVQSEFGSQVQQLIAAGNKIAIVSSIDISHLALPDNIAIITDTDSINNPATYQTIARQLQLPAEHFMLISAREDVTMSDAALETGMGIMTLYKQNGLQDAVAVLSAPDAYQEKTYEDIAKEIYTPGQIRIIGITGRAGTGKTTLTTRLANSIYQIGGKAVGLDLDAFFYLSSAERRAWVNEENLSPNERAYRRNMTNWINHALVNQTFHSIRNGEPVALRDMYSMEKGGEKVEHIDIHPDAEGFTAILGGSALLDPRIQAGFDTLIYINTHETVRRVAVNQRDIARGYSPVASAERFQLTQQSETEDCLSLAQRMAVYNNPDIGVLVVDNSKRDTHVITLPPYIPQR